MVTIRFATNEDRIGIDKITEEFSDNEYSHSPKFFDDAILTQKIFIALDDQKVIGYLISHIIWGNTPFIELLQVTSSYQRKGIGSELLSAFESKMKAEGHEEILSSSEKINGIGNAFHKKQGFKEIGELNMIYGKEMFYLKSLA